MPLQEAKQKCQKFVGQHGIYQITGNDRVIVYSNKPLSQRVINAIEATASPHAVAIFDEQKEKE